MWGAIISAVAPAVIGAIAGGGKGGGGGATGGADKTGAELIRAIQSGTATQATERPLEQIEPATSSKERGEYLVRMLQSIQSNAPEGTEESAMKIVAEGLMRDMQAGTGRIPEEAMIQPQEPDVPRVAAVKLAELEEPEQKEEEPFVRSSSLFG